MTAPASTGPRTDLRRPLFWAVLASFPIGLLVWAQISPGSFEPSLESVVSNLLGIAQLVIVLVLVFLLDTRRTIPLHLATMAFVWGVVVATPMSIYLNTDWLAAWARAGFGTVSAAIVAPVSEELSKAVGALLVLALVLPRRVGPFQGVIVGFLVGAGFEICENVSYGVKAAFAVADPSQSMGAILETFVARSSAGFLLHALCTGIIGAGIALALTATTRRERAIGVLTTGGLMLLAMTLHSLWDLPQLFTSSSQSEIWSNGLYAVMVGSFLTVWFLSRRSDRRARLADESAARSSRPLISS